MAGFNSDKFDNLYKFLIEKNFEINEIVTDDLKCTSCKKLVVNACKVACSCRFCRTCIDGIIEAGSEFCPGIGERCPNQILSTFESDHELNEQISKLTMKCPELSCSHKCELIDMEEHLRCCENKSVTCPFQDVGCTVDGLTKDQMNDHMKQEGYNHMTLLLQTIGNIRNDIIGMRLPGDCNLSEIQNLRRSSEMGTERLRYMQQDIRWLKMEIEDLANHL